MLPILLQEECISLSLSYSTTLCKPVLLVHHHPASQETILLSPPVDAEHQSTRSSRNAGARKPRWIRPSESQTLTSITRKKKQGKYTTRCFFALIFLGPWQDPRKRNGNSMHIRPWPGLGAEGLPRSFRKKRKKWLFFNARRIEISNTTPTVAVSLSLMQ